MKAIGVLSIGEDVIERRELFPSRDYIGRQGSCFWRSRFYWKPLN